MLIWPNKGTTSIDYLPKQVWQHQLDKFGMGLVLRLFLTVIFVPLSAPIPSNLITYEGENKQLTAIPDDIPANVEHLKLSGNRITEITANAFSEFEQLIVLDLSSNLISTIEVGAFNGLGSLQYLYLQNNRISTLDPRDSRDTRELKVLLLGNNDITSITPKHLVSLWELQELGLQNNQISTFNLEDLLKLPDFALKLHLEGNPLVCNGSLCWLDKAYQKLEIEWDSDPTCSSGENWPGADICPEDKYYRGTRRSLTEVPGDIPDDVKEVFLGNNDITEIKANAFSNLANCTHLYLARNKISKIEAGAFKGQDNLKYLDLRNNSLESLGPEVLDDLPRPLELDLEGNVFDCHNSSVGCHLRKEEDEKTITFVSEPSCADGRTLFLNTYTCGASALNESREIWLFGLWTVFMVRNMWK